MGDEKNSEKDFEKEKKKKIEKEPEKQAFVQQGQEILAAVRKGEDGG